MKILVMLANGFEEIEALTVVDVARRAGIETLMVSVSEDYYVDSARKVRVKADKLLKDITVGLDDMIVIPGGQGVAVLEKSVELAELLKKHRSYKGRVAAICAGPSFPGKLGLLNGIKACCYPGFEQYLQGAQVVYDEVAVDNNFITSRGPGTALAFAYAIVGEIRGREVADKMKKDMLYRL
ncbi:MAG: DJ-1/PfpI family protein [Clostridiaceae bacterium]|nr:DJ-1/PfpI family protein [Clostridiaceae bacterium]